MREKKSTREPTTKVLYECDPRKNTKCDKGNCYINGGPCYQTLQEDCKVENELRYYLSQIKDAMTAPTDEENEVGLISVFKPQYLITAVKLPTGAIELAINNDNIAGKIDYILEAYDENMRLKTNANICMVQLMVV